MSAEERETLSLGLAHGHSLRTMATVLGRAPSTLSRESARNATRGRPYRACTAHTLATGRARQPRRLRKLLDPWLWQYVRTHLAEGCSPEQIAGRLRREYPDDMRKHLSSETIYVGLYVLPRGTLRSELLVALRQARKARRPRARGTDRRGHILNMTSIAERPAEVATRTVPGHWEGDLIKGAANASAVGTLVERTSRLVMLVKLPEFKPASAANVLQAFTDKLLSIAAPMRLSMTYDQGREMAMHKELSKRTGIAVYFCDPHSPWQRGSNENMNGLVRQYMPKGEDLSIYSQQQLDAIADEINGRPRKGLGVRSPLAVYRELLLNTPQHSTLVH